MNSWQNKKLGEVFRSIFISVEYDILKRVTEGDFQEEDHITSAIFARIEERINNQNFNGLHVATRQFSSRGPNSDESITGADGSLIVEIPQLEISKFFIFQAKNFTSRNSILNEHAINQKWKMLSCSPDSFFLIYTKRKILFISAFLISLKDKLTDLPSKRFSQFHKDFFDCFIGDHFFGFPRLPFHYPWRYWPLMNEYRSLSKNLPLAKNNLLIQISQNENNELRRRLEEIL